MVLVLWRIPGAPSGAGKGLERIPCLQVIGTLGVAIGIGIAFGIFRAFCWIAWFPGASGARHGAAGAAQESRDASGHNGNDNRFADNDNGRRCRSQICSDSRVPKRFKRRRCTHFGFRASDSGFPPDELGGCRGNSRIARGEMWKFFTDFVFRRERRSRMSELQC